MSSVTAARLKRSAGAVEVLKGDEEESGDGDVDEVDEEDEIDGADVTIEGVGGLSLWREGFERSQVRFWGFGERVESVFVEEVVEEEDEEDEVLNAKENRDGEPGRPIRITVPFEAAESGRGRSGEEGGLSVRGERARRDGGFRRPVRPPEGRSRVWPETGGVGVTGAAVRTQRSGAEYWYDSRSWTRGGARRESRTWNWPRAILKCASMRMFEGRIAPWKWPWAWSQERAETRQ